MLQQWPLLKGSSLATFKFIVCFLMKLAAYDTDAQHLAFKFESIKDVTN